MEDNKEIVKWLSRMNSEGSSATVPNTTLEKSQPVQDRGYKSERKNMSDDNSNLQYLRTAIAETRAENRTLGKEISELIDKLQLNPQTLANDIKDNLQKVSAVLRSEGLCDTDEAALTISVDGKRVREKKQQRINSGLKAKYKELLHRHSVLERKLNYLKENVGSIKDSIVENEAEYKDDYSSYKLLSAKLVEYNVTTRVIETEIDCLNLRELEPEKILDKYKRFTEKKGRLAEIDQALMQYSNLPPNLLQAKAILESKQLEYNDITKRFLNMT